jgi:predicted Ser/Thr protein kinase
MAQGDIFLAVELVDPHRVALAEGAAAAVLAGQPNAMAVGEQAAERERLGRRPIEALAALEHHFFGVEDALERLVDGEAFGNRRQDLAQPLELGRVDGGRDIAAAEHRLIGAPEPCPPALEPVGLVRQI